MTTRRSLFVASALTLALVSVGMATAQAADLDVGPTNIVSGVPSTLTAPRAMAVVGSSVFVADNAQSKIQRFEPGSGTFLPNYAIQGAKTSLNSVYSVSVDAAGNFWTTNLGNDSVASFAKDAVGDTPPRLTISGANTGIDNPTDVVVGPGRRVYVASQANDTVRIFPPDTGGNIAPVDFLDLPAGLAVNGIAIDSKGLLYVVGSGVNKIFVYRPGATAPFRTIEGPATGLATAQKIAIDSSDNVYVANSTGPSVTVFAPGANGNVVPLQRIIGPNTHLDSPTGIALDADRNIYVANNTPGVVRFAALIPLLKPTAARTLKVSGTAKSAKRTVTWTAPSSDGGTPVTKYVVIVRKGTATLYNKTVSASTHAYVLSRAKLKKGNNTVYVYAYNRKGAAPAAVKAFTVKK